MRVVIVGAGLGALRAAESLRGSGFAGDIVVVGEELHPPYNRPPLSKEALAAETTFEQLAFRMKSNVEDVEWRLGERIARIDQQTRVAQLAAGEVLEWDALVAATGVVARRLDVPGPLAGRLVVRTLDDALELRARLVRGGSVLILGAGFIGCEVASTARQLGCQVTCAAYDAAPMLRPLGGVLAGELQRRHEERGVTFHLGQSVKRFLGEHEAQGVELADGTEVRADVIVEAVGSRCATDWLEGNGFDLSDGVLTDAALRPLTADGPIDGIAVVGDIARYPNVRFDAVPRRVEHWSNPTDTGRHAGTVLASFLSGNHYADVLAKSFEPLPSFWSDQYDFSIQSFGMPGIADRVEQLEGDLSGEVVMGYMKGHELVGVAGIGMLRALSSYRDRIGQGRG